MTEHAVSLSYHLNLNHRDLQPEQRDTFLYETLEQTLSDIQVPTSLSASAEDLLIVKHGVRPAWNVLLDNPNIKLTPSLYSHMLAEQFPDNFLEQARVAHGIIATILPPDKVLPFAFAPEVSVPPKGAIKELAKLWRGAVFCDERAVGDKGDKLPPIFTTEQDMAYVESVRELKYRDIFHRYLREYATSEDVLDALHSDARVSSEGSPLIARIDLEAPVFNQVHFETESGVHRTDLFAKLQREYKKRRDTRFVFLDEELLDIARSKPFGQTPIASPGAKDKWENEELENQVKLHEGAEGYLRLLYLSAQTSDYFINDVPDITLPAIDSGRRGNIHIRRDGSARRYELCKKLSSLVAGATLECTLSSSDNSYLALTHEATNEALKILNPIES